MQVISFKNWLDLYEGFEDEPYSFHAVFMAGGPASGKTTVATSMFGSLGFKFSNVDAIYERLSKGWLGTKGRRAFNPSAEGDETNPDYFYAKRMRKFATKLTLKQAGFWRNMRFPLVIDVTSRDKESVVKLDDDLKQLGYDTFMVFVNTDLSKAVERNLVRSQIGGFGSYAPRAAGSKETEQFWHDAQSNKGYYQLHFGDNFVEVDNSQDYSPGGRQYAAGKEFPDMRNKQTEWHRIALKLLGPPNKVKNPIGARLMAQRTDYQAMANNRPQQPQPSQITATSVA